MKILGFEIKRQNEEIPSPVPKMDDDGGLQYYNTNLYNSPFSSAVTFDASLSDDAALISKYRQMVNYGEIDYAVDDIINEMVSSDEDVVVDLNLDKLEYSESIKKKIRDEFDYILNLLDFHNKAYDIARRWYVDGRLYYQIISRQEHYKTKGIEELRYVDPRQIKKVIEIDTPSDETVANGNPLVQIKNVYFIYSKNGVHNNKVNPGNSKNDFVRLTEDSVAYVNSGLLSADNKMILSHLHKAIVPLNQLMELEDAIVIYRLARSSEKRVFYIDVGNLPYAKAQQHLQNVANKYKSKLSYNRETGVTRNDVRFSTFTEDFFLPRSSNGRATEVTTLPGGQGLNADEEVGRYLDKLRRSLNVPLSRFEQGAGFMLGRNTEISRDEMKFSKFVTRLRKRFSGLFLELLEKQIILKGIMSIEEFEKIKNDFVFDFTGDNLFAEIKQNEVLSGRLEILRDIEQYKGTYFSSEYIRKNVLRQSDEDIEEIDKQIKDNNDEPPEEV